MIAFAVLCVFIALAVLCIANRISGNTYVHKVMLYIDIFACALLTRNPDMTLSARCGLYCRHDPPFVWFILGKLLNTIQKNHLELAIAADLTRAKEAIKQLSEP